MLFGEVYNENMPYLLVSNSIVVEASDKFARLTGYRKEDIKGLQLHELCNILRINSPSKLENVYEKNEHLLFTGDLDVKEVQILCQELDMPEHLIYYFKERNNASFENGFQFAEQIIEDNRIGLAIYSVPELILLKANQKYLDYFDEPYNRRENSIGRTQSEIVTGYNGSNLEKIWENIVETGQAFYDGEVEYKNLLRGTTYRDLSLIPITFEERVKYIVEMATDISEKVRNRKIIEEQARTIEQKNKQLEAIFDNIAEGVFVADRNERFILCNSEAKKFVYEPENVERLVEAYNGTDFYDMDGNSIPYEKLPLQRSLRGEIVKNSRAIIKLPDKEVIVECNASPIYDENGEVAMALLCTRDITENVMYEENIRKQRDEMYRIFNMLNFPIIRLTYPDFKIIEMNDNGHRFLTDFLMHKAPGLKEMNGQGVLNFVPYFRSGRHFESIEEMAKSKSSICARNISLDIHDKKMYTNIIYRPIFGIDGAIIEFLIVIVDVTDEIMERNKIQEIMNLQEQFFSFIAHEFKTPLTTINATIQLLELTHRNEMTEKVNSSIDSIKRSTYQQLRLVNNLLDITRAEAGYLKMYKKKFDIVGMTKSIIESISSFACEKDINLNFKSSFDEKIIAIDDEKYERIILNLLSNAIKFTPRGKQIYISISETNGNVEICVRDQGVGIPKEKQSLIFDRFGQVGSTFTRSSEGTGIGLSLVKLLVKAMKGDIRLKSKIGKGSTFTIILPDNQDVEVEDLLEEFTDDRLINTMKMEFANINLDE